jgi:DNA-binding response OmpR family regulator
MADLQTILIVDDEAPVRALCRRILVKAGFQVLEAEDGKQAQAILAAGTPITLLLADVIMPRMDGPSLVDSMLQECADLCVLYMSAETAGDPRLERHLRECGCDFLAKPFTPVELVGKIRALLGRRQFPPSSIAPK